MELKSVNNSLSPPQLQLNSLLEHYQNGRYDEAERLAISITKQFPNDQFSWKVLGAVLQSKNKISESLIANQKAVEINPKDTEVHYNLANILKELGRLEEAEVSFKEAIRLKLNFIEAYSNLGVLLQELGRLEEALIIHKEAIALNLSYPEVHYNFGITLKELGRLEEAELSYRRAIALNPNYTEAHSNLGNTLKELGRLKEAEASCRQAIAVNSDYAEAYSNLGIIQQELGRLKEAEASYRKAIEINPELSVAHNNLGVTLKELGLLNEVEVTYRKAIEINPEFSLAHNNLGLRLHELGRLEEAEASFRQAISLKPGFPDAYNNLANTLAKTHCKLGKILKPEDVEASYRQAIDLKPDYTEAHSNKNMYLNYSLTWSPQFIYQQHIEFEKQFGGLKIRTSLSLPVNKNCGERLRIGYVSPDFRQHSVAYFFEPLLENHNPNTIETFCYYNNKVVDATTKRLMTASDHWRSIYKISDQDVVDLIKNDKIDILVDLSGHTGNNSLLVFAQKPASIQVAWLGYPNTTGLSAIDYRFTDIIADPIGEADDLHSEKLFRLPNGFQCYKGDQTVPVGIELPQKRQDYVTFGSFNNFMKITPEVIKTWSKILLAVPKSVLLLKCNQLNQDENPYLKLFKNEGITEDRLKVYERLSSMHEHLELYNSIDIGLDPFPFNGATTTCEALWMGVPVITLLGDRHVGRVGASILNNVGLTDFIAEDIDGYIQLAIEKAANKDYLQEIRKGLRERMQSSQLCNAISFASDVENAYQVMYRELIENQRDPNE